jgi:uncharacterized protein with HEPN domain
VKDERTYLTHAIEAIDAIANCTSDGREAFFSDGKTQDAVIRKHRDHRSGGQGHLR